jgi:hypothetical protein
MYAQKLGALFAASAALGTSSYYVAHGVSGNGATTTAPAAPTSTNAAAALDEGGGAKAPGGGRCGKERWAIKTLTDPDAGKIDLTPIPSSVTALGSVAPPAKPDDLPRQPQEMNVYRVEGTIVAFKREKDSDIHLAIADPAPGPHPTMIAEFPAAFCETGALAEGQIDRARSDFEAAYGKPTANFKTPTGCVTLTGVFFFDKIHGQLGVAPNGAELHPVLDFQNGCGAAQGTTTTTAPTTSTTAGKGAKPATTTTP